MRLPWLIIWNDLPKMQEGNHPGLFSIHEPLKKINLSLVKMDGVFSRPKGLLLLKAIN